MTTAQIQAIKQRYSIVGNCDGLNRAIEMAMKVAPIDFSVLVMGENGVGKEVFPRIIHDASLRRNKKYLAVNCGAIPEGTIDSELGEIDPNSELGKKVLAQLEGGNK